jgi:hypothetical protein
MTPVCSFPAAAPDSFSSHSTVRRCRGIAGQVVRAGENHGGLLLFRRTVRSSDYGHQARLLTEFWADSGHAWDWINRIVYLPKSP